MLQSSIYVGNAQSEKFTRKFVHSIRASSLYQNNPITIIHVIRVFFYASNVMH